MVRIIKTYKLSELIHEDNIVSVVQRESLFGKSLAIAIKGQSYVEDKHRYIFLPSYGGVSSEGTLQEGNRAIFISMDKYTYNIPDYIALPKELYKYVKVMLKEDDEHNIRFIKCSITRKVNW